MSDRPSLPSGVELDLDLRPAWRLVDAAIEADAIAFWERLGILPAGVTPHERAAELAAAAYQDGVLAGVTTATIARYEPLRGRFAFLRCAVDPGRRRAMIAIALTAFTRDLIEQWSADHPDERVLGLAGIVESADLAQRQREPEWPTTRLNAVGYTPDARQVRIAWFRHARLD